ncbi:MAG: aminotransferase class IV [Candidatus Nanopelagicales bacterium]
MKTFGWIEDVFGGNLVTDPKVSAFDSGFTLGFGIFETMKTRGQLIQFLDFHLQRLSASATALQLEIPANERIESAIRSVLDANNPDSYGRLRVSLTQGIQGVTPWTLIITWQAIQLWTNPASLTISNVSQSETRLSKSMKTLSYLENAFALQQALRNGFDDAIMFDTSNHVTETALANIFIVKNNSLYTPPASTGCLLGITRHIIMREFVDSLNVFERNLTLSEIESADEILITSAIRDVQPVQRVDSWHYKSPGKITSTLQGLYREYAEGGFQ